MERNKTLICLILRMLNESQRASLGITEIDGYEPELVRYHLKLCRQAGFVDPPYQYPDTKPVLNYTLTWQGHNALDKLQAGCSLSDITA